MKRAWVGLVAVTSGCALYEGTPQPGPGSASYVVTKDVPQDTTPQVDLLVVIDDSPAVAPYVASLRRNAPAFGDVIDQVEGGLHRMHVGVVTGGAGCSPTGTRLRPTADGHAFLDYQIGLDGAPEQNFSGAFVDAFAQLVDVGTAGCAAQQPLAAVTGALADPRNAGFRRADAELFVLLISAQDDGSLGDVAALAAQLHAQSATDEVAIGGVFPPEAVRLGAFLAAFPNRSTSVPIAQDDLTESLRLFVELSTRDLGGVPCMDANLVDADPIAAGLQPSCSVSDVQDLGTASQAEQLLPACDATSSVQPCWRLVADPVDCPDGPDGAGYVLTVDRPSYAPDHDHVIAQCEAR